MIKELHVWVCKCGVGGAENSTARAWRKLRTHWLSRKHSGPREGKVT